MNATFEYNSNVMYLTKDLKDGYTGNCFLVMDV